MMKAFKSLFNSAPSLSGAMLVLALLFAPLATGAQNSVDPLRTLIFEPELVNTSTSTTASSSASNSGNEEKMGMDFPAASLSEYRTAINSSIESGSQYSQALSEQYEALGILLFQQGSFAEANDSFESAIHIKKVNLGLFNLDQTRLIEYLIRTQIALGDFKSVDNHKHYLYYLQDKNLAADDPELLSAKLDWADWNVEAFVKGYRETYTYPIALTDSIDAARNINNRIQINVPVNREPVDNSPISSPGVAPIETVTETMPVIINVPLLNSNSVVTNAAITDYNLRSVPFALSNDIVVNQRLHEAEEIYESILEQLENSDSSTLMQQQDIQYKLANINYLLKKELDQYQNIRDRGSIAYNRVNQEYTTDADMLTSRRYVSSKNSLADLVEKIELSDDNSPTEKANAYIALGDLHLSFDRPQRASQAYTKAHSILLANGYSSADADSFLSPTPVIEVPAYGIHNYSRKFYGLSEDIDIPYKGYIDVTFSKDKFGQINSINVVDSSEENTGKIQTALIDHLRSQRFRPYISAGKSAEQNNIALRYYFYH